MGTLTLVWGIMFVLSGLYYLAEALVFGPLFAFLGYSGSYSFILGIVLILIGGFLIKKYDIDKKRFWKFLILIFQFGTIRSIKVPSFLISNKFIEW